MLLQDLVPVLAFLHRKVNVETHVRPRVLGGYGRDSHTDHLHQHSPRSICIERRYDFGTLR